MTSDEVMKEFYAHVRQYVEFQLTAPILQRLGCSSIDDELPIPDTSNEIHLTGLDGYETFEIDNKTIGIRPKWISVKDRLPDIYEFVLVYSKMPGNCEPCPITIARWNGEKWEIICEGQENNACACGDLFWSTESEDITHWMPLPEPPKENE